MDEARLQELWDHHEIRQLLATYCHGCDRADETEMASVYCEDSWDDHGAYKMQGKQYADECIEEALRTTKLISHQLGQSFIKVNGGTAGVETYFIATLIVPDENGGDIFRQLGGRYVDRLEREDGKWRIKKRQCVREWSICHQLTPANDWLAGAGFIETQRGPQDVSWETLGLEYSGGNAQLFAMAAQS